MAKHFINLDEYGTKDYSRLNSKSTNILLPPNLIYPYSGQIFDGQTTSVYLYASVLGYKKANKLYLLLGEY